MLTRHEVMDIAKDCARWPDMDVRADTVALLAESLLDLDDRIKQHAKDADAGWHNGPLDGLVP